MTKQDRQNWTGVAILSVVLHALLFAYHTGAMAHIVSSGTALSGAFLICSGGTLRSIQTGQDGEPDGPDSAHIIVKCPICSAVGACAPPPEYTGLSAPATESLQSFVHRREDQPYPDRLAYSHAARAPPLVG